MRTPSFQPGILQPLPACARYLQFQLQPTATRAQISTALQALSALCDGESLVVGLGASLLTALDKRVPGLREFPDLRQALQPLSGQAVALWCWLRAGADADLGHLLAQSRQVEQVLAPALVLDQVVDAFSHAHGRDLSGYEDGTENPAEPLPVALCEGASFVAVQQWQHDFAALAAMAQSEKDNTIGRRQADNEELDDAPASAHVKRTAQESFTPEAFVWRRSMPWASAQQGGLMFVAFGHSLDAFEAQMRRMVGLDDGVVDGLFNISRVLHSAYFWCPAMHQGRLDLRALGL